MSLSDLMLQKSILLCLQAALPALSYSLFLHTTKPLQSLLACCAFLLLPSGLLCILCCALLCHIPTVPLSSLPELLYCIPSPARSGLLCCIIPAHPALHTTHTVLMSDANGRQGEPNQTADVADGAKKKKWLRLALSLCLKLPGLKWASEPLHI